MLSIEPDRIRSDRTDHGADLVDGVWLVTWLPGRRLTAVQAECAMRVAEIAATEFEPERAVRALDPHGVLGVPVRKAIAWAGQLVLFGQVIPLDTVPSGTDTDADADRVVTRRNTRVVVIPIVHESHGRITRRTWGGGVGLVDDPADGPARIRCPHSHGHKTTAAAEACARRLWRALPEESSPEGVVARVTGRAS